MSKSFLTFVVIFSIIIVLVFVFYDYVTNKDELNIKNIAMINNVDKVYQEIPTDNNCEITTMKDRLEDNTIADRIDPNLLNPFRQNPYTQPLEFVFYDYVTNKDE